MADSVAEQYMHSILGQQHPLSIPSEDCTAVHKESYALFLRLLQVDSLFNLGQTEEAKILLSTIRLPDATTTKGTSTQRRIFFRNGLQALLVNDNLTESYHCFVQASNDASGLEAVFYGERAVNIAFWIACSGKMLAAAQYLDVYVKNMPYAGGVLSFAKYMNGDVTQAQQIAQEAMVDGFCDPWTIHAIAHCLYSQGKSLECTEFLDQHRSVVQQANPSAFMKGHMEFHQALCYIDLEDVKALHALIDGPLWRDLTELEQHDYWNATGLLNIQWKAELRGLSCPRHNQSLEAALTILVPTASASKSSVFSLCILRWTSGAFRIQWRDQLLESDNQVLRDLTHAIDLVYPSSSSSSSDGEYATFCSEGCSSAVEKYLVKNADALDQLGASPEQREVIEEFLVVATKAAGNEKFSINTNEMKGWTIRNYRPNVKFYGSFLGLQDDQQTP